MGLQDLIPEPLAFYFAGLRFEPFVFLSGLRVSM